MFAFSFCVEVADIELQLLASLLEVRGQSADTSTVQWVIA